MKWQNSHITKQVSVNNFSLVSCRNGYAIYLFFSLVPNSHFYQDSGKNWDLWEEDFIYGSPVKRDLLTEKRYPISVPAKSDLDLQDRKFHFFLTSYQ